MSENKAISCKEDTANESEDDETEGADEVSEDCEDQDEDHASTIQADVEDDSESLDPRIQEELEKLNCSTDVINKLEVDLEEARHTFRILMRESSQQLERLAKQIGPSSVEKARPYYEARMRARRAHAEAQRAALRFEKASNAHEAAKEMVTLAEEGYKEKGCLGFDQAWQEMLNHASSKVNESEVERNASAAEHRIKSHTYSQAEGKVQQLYKNAKKHVNKSKPYFELKARFNQILDDQKRQVQVIEETIAMTKEGYSDSLKELEKISEEIHQRRAERQKTCQKNNVKLREQGVGAENPATPTISSKTEKGQVCCDHDGDETDGFRLNVKLDKTEEDEISLLSTESSGAKVTPKKATIKSLDQQTSFSSSSANTTASNASTASSSPPFSPGYEELKESSKMHYLTVRKLSDDEFSEADSMTSMEQLDDDQVEQLMLETEGFDILEDAKTPTKNPTLPPVAS